MTDPTTPVNPVSMTRRDLEARIIAKAWRDPEYKKRLLSDPKGVLQSEIQAIDPAVKLPDSLQAYAHEETANTYHFVLPRNPRDISLSEVLSDDLEAVAPQTIAVVVVAAVALNTVGAVNSIGVANVVGAGNVATTGNAVANFNTVG
jgi:hypothetical protein